MKYILRHIADSDEYGFDSKEALRTFIGNEVRSMGVSEGSYDTKAFGMYTYRIGKDGTRILFNTMVDIENDPRIKVLLKDYSND